MLILKYLRCTRMSCWDKFGFSYRWCCFSFILLRRHCGVYSETRIHRSLHSSPDIFSVCVFEMHVFTVMICSFVSFQIPPSSLHLRLPSLSSCFLSSLLPTPCFYHLPSPGLLLPSMREGDLGGVKLFMIINQWPDSIHSLPLRK